MANATSAAVSPFRMPLVLVSELPLPPLLSGGITVLHYCYRIQREFLSWDARSKSPFLYLAGVLVRSQYYQSSLVQAVAKVVLVARECFRVVESGEEVVRCIGAFYESLKIPDTMTFQYSVHRIRLQDSSSSKHWFSLLSRPFIVIEARVSLVAHRVFSLLCACWQLSVAMSCLSEASASDPSAAINDLFVNLEAVVTSVASEEEKISKQLRSNTFWVDRSLQLMGIPLSAKNIIETLDQCSIQMRRIEDFFSRPPR